MLGKGFEISCMINSEERIRVGYFAQWNLVIDNGVLVFLMPQILKKISGVDKVSLGSFISSLLTNFGKGSSPTNSIFVSCLESSSCSEEVYLLCL